MSSTVEQSNQGNVSYYQFDFLQKKFALTFIDYLNDHDTFAKNFSRLMKDLPAEQQSFLKTLYTRVNFIHYASLYTLHNFTTEEIIEQQKALKDYYPKIQKLEEEKCFKYEDYLLPVNHFEISVFYYELGLNFIKKKENLAGKDILDIGAFVGDSPLVLNKLNPNKIYAFEPVSSIYEQMLQTIKLNKMENVVTPCKLGFAEYDGEIEIGVDGSGSSTETWKDSSQVNKEIIKLSTIDNFVEENNINVGLIKIDTESCELDILKGAVETIRKYKPVLLVSIYHTAVDFFEAKAFIEDLDLGYKFNVAKFNPFSMLFETVLIAEV